MSYEGDSISNFFLCYFCWKPWNRAILKWKQLTFFENPKYLKKH